MKALELVAYNQLEYKDVPMPEIGPEDVMIQVKACGICGSDVHGMDGSSGRRIPPIIMGHEAAGVIAELGSGVLNGPWEVGDRVTFDSMIYCGECEYCLRGQTNLCDNRQVVGVSPGDYRRHGAFAEFVVVPARVLFKLPDELSFEKAALIEPVTVAMHAVDMVNVSEEDTALVMGAGMIGTLTLQMLQVRGCGKVIVVDLDDNKLRNAAELGASLTLNPSKVNVDEEIAKLTGGVGVDLSFEAVGVTPTTQAAINNLRKGGTCVLIGNVTHTVEFPMQAVVTREISVLGSCGSAGDYPEALELIARGKINVDGLISEIRPLKDGAECFERLHRADEDLMKILLKPE